MLASVPTNLVHSEPGWLLDLLGECERQGLSEAARVGVVCAAVLGMGRSGHHSDMFVELPPPAVPHMGVLLQAFPETPWAFVYHRCVRGLNCLEGSGDLRMAWPTLIHYLRQSTGTPPSPWRPLPRANRKR